MRTRDYRDYLKDILDAIAEVEICCYDSFVTITVPCGRIDLPEAQLEKRLSALEAQSIKSFSLFLILTDSY